MADCGGDAPEARLRHRKGSGPAGESGTAAKLGRYRQKRDFGKSPEPSGRDRSEASDPAAAQSWSRLPRGRRFCVQLHHASRLHYDFRLEYRGVLLSWAVPKGPSMDPRQRRLAVQVEDHPLDYGDFEDVIPSGYGAGTVLVWDMGRLTWEKGPKGDPEQGLRQGHLDFSLDGQKLKGGFSLIRMERAQRATKPQWLLVKRQDDQALEAGQDPPPTSVKTGRTLEQVAAGASPEPPPAAGPEELGQLLAKAPRGKIPASLSPMLATLVDAPFSDPNWLFELKYDGVRGLLRLDRGRITVQGRSGRDETDRYPELQEVAPALNASDCLLDGEIVALDREGRPSFSQLQSRIQLRPAEAARAAAEKPIVFMAFDLLFAEGHDLRQLPLRERKHALRVLLGESPLVRYADEVWERGEDFYHEVSQRQLEGVIAKRAESTYATAKRSRNWLKIKVRPTQDCVVCGYLPGKGRRKALGALVLGVYAAGELVPAGRVGTGFSDRLLTELRQQLDRLRRQSPPWSGHEASSREIIWAEPRLVCEVEHAGWTVTQKLRQPSFRALRPDVPPKACIREPGLAREEVRVSASPPGGGSGQEPTPSGPAVEPEIAEALEELAQLPARGGQLRVGRRTLTLTHLDKQLWPQDGITKRDLIEYHLRIASSLLPHLQDRAVVTRVFPDGISGKSFWRRAVPESAPAWLPRWKARPGTPTICPLIQEPAALVWLANQGTIEIHPWHSRRDRPTDPDWAVFDLDPGPGAGLAEAVEVAHLVKAGLDHLKLRAWLKTTGKSGLHIYVPLRRGPDQEQVRSWVGELAHQVAQVAPQLVTETWTVRGRGQGRVRIDYTQNVVGKTLAAVYSPRSVPGAPVSTPIDWGELEHLDPSQFNLRTVLERVGQRGDLFQPVLAGGQRLPKLAESFKPPRRSSGHGGGRK